MTIDPGNPRPLEPVNAEPTETSPLLASQDGVGNLEATGSSRLSRIMQFQRAHLALPVVFFGFMSGTITVTTSFEILKIIACQFWYNEHVPSKIPPGGNIPVALCEAPGVQEMFAWIVQIAVVVDLCGALITSSPIGTLSAKFGRKPLLIATTILAIIAPLVLLAGLYNGSLMLILLSTTIAAVGGPRQLSLLSTMFIVDVTNDPALILSVLEGSAYLGNAISFTLGGLVTRWSGGVTYVFWIQAAIFAVLLLYIIVAIPESFGQEKRTARAAEVAAEQSRGRGSTSRQRSRSRSMSLERVRDTAGAYARPFRLIWPRRDTVSGKRNLRLLLLSIAILFAFTGVAYAGPAFLVYATNRFHATPENNGYLLSSLATGRAIFLFLVLPPILKWGRTHYKKHQPGEARVFDTESPGSHFDIYMLAIAWLADSLSVLGVGLSPNLTLANAWFTLMVMGSASVPCISTIVSASVEPLARGEALAAIALVRSVAEFLSPIILGSILSNTTNSSLPQTMFFVSSIMLFLAVGIVVLVKDSDKYVPREDNT